MADIRFISTSTVRSTTPYDSTDHEKVELSPWDLHLLLVGPIQKGLLFPKYSTNVIDHLKTTLSLTLHFFPPLSGRLAAAKHDDNTTSFSIHCNNSGAEFIHAVAENVVANDILEPVIKPPFLHSFFPLNGIRNCDGISKPLLAVQVTELSDGLFVGCTINHTVGDGSAFSHFLNSWSEIARGSDRISQPPSLERWVPENINFPIRFTSCEFQVDDNFLPPHLEEGVFHFTKEKIARLKAKANSEIGDAKVIISSLQALLAHIWRSVVRCRRVESDQETKYKLLIGARLRLRPPLPENYFGNAVNFGTVTTEVVELLRHGLGWAALEMNGRIASQTDEKIRGFLEKWAESPKLVKMGDVTSNALITSSLPRFDVYGCDFGWGKPMAVRSGLANKHDGKITVFPGAEEGSINIEVCLLPETLEAVVHDSEFMDAV